MSGPVFFGPGYIVESIGTPYGPALDSHDFFEVPEPRPPGTPIDPMADRYGRDLRMVGGDLEIDGNGDLVLTRGLGAVRAAWTRSIGIYPGELAWRPSYGVGAPDFLGRPVSVEVLSELKSRVRASLANNEAVEGIDRLETVQSMAEPGQVELLTVVRVAGQPTDLSVAIREA